MKHNIAVIDNDSDTCLIIKKMLLRNRKCTVDTFLLAQTFLRLKNMNDYKLIITDLEMPYMNGVELANTLRETNINAIIVLVSGRNLEGEEYEIFDAILQKPISPSDIDSLFEYLENRI